MAQIIDFNEAKRKRNLPELEELRALYEDVVTLDIDAALEYNCGINESETGKEEADKLDILLRALRTNPSLANIDKALGVRKSANQ